MTGTRPADILRHFEHTGADATADADLLARFARHRDQAAFAVLVRRHGPVVLAVCRRITNHPQDAEDAFQAVFLVLARNAAALRRPDLLGNWLYGVAVRVAQKARRSAARRRAREVQAVNVPEPAVPTAELAEDVGPILHEELARLPAWYRQAVVLCDLRGVSRAEAAKQLGIPEGTLSSRLAGGRKRLADRLARRGVALTAAVIPAALGEARGAAAVPDSLVSKTCGLVADWSAGALVPGLVLRLADGGVPVRKVMLLGLFTTALTAAGVVFAARSDGPPKPNDPLRQPDPVAKAEVAAIPAPDPKGDEKARGFTAHPKLRKVVDLPLDHVYEVVWSPDGKQLAVRGHNKGGIVPGMQQVDGGLNVVHFYDPAAGKDLGRAIYLTKPGRLVGFTPDGKNVVTDLREDALVSGRHQLEFWEPRADLDKPPVGKFPPGGAENEGARGRNIARVRTAELEPEPTHGYAFAPDGKTFRTVYLYSAPGQFGPIGVREVSAETGKTLRTLVKAESDVFDFALSVNGKRFAVADETGGVEVWNVDKGIKEHTVIERQKPQGAPSRRVVRLSSDGRLLLVLEGGPRVFDNETGKWAPDPEGKVYIRPLEADDPLRPLLPRECFSADNRLVVVTGYEILPRAGTERECIKVWETATGKLLKSWNHWAKVAWSPVAPVLAVLEPNGENQARLGFWDFSARPDEQPKPKPEEEKLSADIRRAREKGVAFLKQNRTPQVNWEGIALEFAADMDGGMTGLVTLALLEAGVPANDPAVSKAVDYLASLPAKKTYVVSLQTQVLARVDAKKYAAVIQRNADWLMDKAIRKEKQLAGWSYPGNAVADGSNTHFAVVALHAADKAGAKVPAAVWRDIREMYLRTALKDGWPYHGDAPAVDRASHSMTGAALCGLTVTASHLDGKAGGPAAKITGEGWKAFLGREGSEAKSEGYMLLVTAELGGLVGGRTFTDGEKEIEWYTAGAAKLVKDQKPDGSWVLGSGLDANPVYSTAAALYFLGSPKK